MSNRESGYYPAGAEFDPNAPWNEKDDGEEWTKKFHKATCDVCDARVSTNEDFICEECFDSMKQEPTEKEIDRDDAD